MNYQVVPLEKRVCGCADPYDFNNPDLDLEELAVSLVHFANGDLVLVSERPGSSAQVQVLSEGVLHAHLKLSFFLSHLPGSSLPICPANTIVRVIFL